MISYSARFQMNRDACEPVTVTGYLCRDSRVCRPEIPAASDPWWNSFQCRPIHTDSRLLRHCVPSIGTANTFALARAA